MYAQIHNCPTVHVIISEHTTIVLLQSLQTFTFLKNNAIIYVV